MMMEDGSSSKQHVYQLEELMNTLVKEALGIPAHVTWGSIGVFDTLRVDFMKPVTKGSKLY